MRISRQILFPCGIAALLLAGCATTEKASREAVPIVRVADNASGVKVISSRPYSQEDMVAEFYPTIPSGVTMTVERIQPQPDIGPGYFVAMSGKIKIVSLEHPEQYPFDETAAPQWKALLSTENTGKEAHDLLDGNKTGKQLNEIPWVNAARCFHGKLQYKTFPWGKAALFLTTYVQDASDGPINNDGLVLVAQGITNDGRFAVHAQFDIAHPNLPGSHWDNNGKKKVLFDLQKEGRKAEKWFARQPDDSFAPTFGQYEAFLAALQIVSPVKK